MLINLRLIGFLTALTMLAASSVDAADRKNVLFIAVDDLRPELGCYGAEHIRSPNIDRLAASGLRFERAYCQQAVCNPSRTSLMTGLRPDTIGVTGNHSHFRTNNPHVVTLPQHFRNHGYHAAAIGKLYHGVFPKGSSKTTWDTMGDPESWSVPAVRFGPRYYYTEAGIAAAKATFERVYKPKNAGPDDWAQKLVFGPATESPNVSDNVLYDGKVAAAAIDALRNLKQKTEQPFFLAVGFIKPHSPYIAPKKYFDLYDNVDLATRKELPDGSPGFAGHRSGELRRYTDQPNDGPIGDDNQRRVRHAYYACVSYIDAQIGRVLDQLDRLGLAENTIVSLYGDHGYHLGEQGLWGKTTNFELDTRVPLIIRAPGMKAAGRSTTSLVELVDLYPTLADLSGLPVGGHLEGQSLAVLLDHPDKSVKQVALSQYPRRGGLMGYSMRTPTHRLTQWVHRQSGDVRATELYEYKNGPVETKNIAHENPELVRKLARQFAATSPATFAKKKDGAGTKSPGATSFENAQPGVFKMLDSPVGTWTATSGRVLIDNKHATTGSQCLQLPGGPKSVVELTIADGVNTNGRLMFRAERWTKRTPFSFRVEKYSAGKWTQVYNGDRHVIVGRPFLSSVNIPLENAAISKLRFIVTSPPNTGVLIDDLRFVGPKPAQNQTAKGNQKRPNILFIVSEDNSEHLGCYGEKRVHTPHLDRLAAGGVRYTRAYVPYSVCSPSRAAFLTGLYTRQTGHIGLATHRFSMYRDFKTMPAYFQQAGYYTGFLGKTHINPERLVEDHVDHRAIRNSNFGKTVSIETYANEAGTVMANAAAAKKPFLLIINYADAHRRFIRKSQAGFPTRLVNKPIEPFPWIGSDTPEFREELREYFNCMNRLDEGVGMVLQKLDEAGASNNTLVIYISDHGADFPRGKGSIYENGTRIPMIVNAPKHFAKGKVENGMVSTIDILPTMLRAAEIPVPKHLPGIALQDIDSGKVSARKFIHTFTTGSSPNLLYMQFGIRDDRYKLIYNPDRILNRLAESRYKNSKLPASQHVQAFLHPPEFELFDLQEDPHEWKNLANSAKHQEIRQRLLAAMRKFQIEIKDPFASKANVAAFLAEQKAYQRKPYRKAGFRWPHLDMFKAAQESVNDRVSP